MKSKRLIFLHAVIAWSLSVSVTVSLEDFLCKSILFHKFLNYMLAFLALLAMQHWKLVISRNCCFKTNKETKVPSHYRPGLPPGSSSMSKIGTWFLIVHVNSLDRKCPKVNHPSGAFGENGLF